MKPLVSIITIVYNDESGIANTIQSVLNQSYLNYEYIIIDGASTDKTLKVIKSFQSEFQSKNINYFWLSEKDKGVYDAMNKGVFNSNGIWCNFMNSGDFFCNSNVLDKVFESELAFKNKVIVYGNKIFKNNIIKPLPISDLKKGFIMANHQSMFFNKAILNKDLYYDLKYPIYSDYEIVNRVFLKFGSQKFQYIPVSIANYLGGGISSKPSFQKRIDKFLILLKHYGFVGMVKAYLNIVTFKLQKKKKQ